MPKSSKLSPKATKELEAQLDAVESNPDESYKAGELVKLATHLSEPRQIERALNLASAIGDEASRANAVKALIPKLTPELLQSGLQIAQSIQDEELQKAVLYAFAKRLQPKKRFATTLASAMSGPWPLMLLSFFIALIITGALAWVCWIKLMPGLWGWGYDDFSWRSLVAWLPAFYLAIIPFLGLMLIPFMLEFWHEYGSVRKQVTSAREAQLRIEEELLKDDPQKLILIVGYSRQMLSEYYGIAMSQAQRSFRYCLIAMWLGFFVLIAGVLDNYIPLRHLLIDALKLSSSGNIPAKGPDLSPNDFVLITGVVIEFIAAAFLWVYRFSIQQQTYYYRRQLKLHNVLLAHRLNEGMTASKDDAIKMVVQRLLEDTEMQQMDGPSTSGLGKFFKAK